MTSVIHDQRDAVTAAAPRHESVAILTVSCHQPDTTVCRLVGSLDLITAPVLAVKLSDALHAGRPHVVIDLSAIAHLDVVGLHVVLEALDCYDIAGHLAVVVDSSSAAITRPDIMALDEIIDIHHDLAGALRACGRAPISTGGRHRVQCPT